MYKCYCNTYPLININDKELENSITKKVSVINKISTLSIIDIPDIPIDS